MGSNPCVSIIGTLVIRYRMSLDSSDDYSFPDTFLLRGGRNGIQLRIIKRFDIKD